MIDPDGQVPSDPVIKLDELDTQIVQLLQEDGRMSYTDIGRQIGVAEAKIRYRVQRLIETGAITIQAHLNLDKVSYRNIAIVGLFLKDLNRVEEIAYQLCEMDNVSYVAITTGRFDLVLEVAYDSHAELLEFKTKLRQIPDIVASEVDIVLRWFKTQYSAMLKKADID